MGPFGPQNPDPLFVTRNVSLKSHRVIKDKHLKMSVTQNGGRSFEAIAFGKASIVEDWNADAKFDIAYHLDENEYMGHKTLQLVVKDMKKVWTQAEVDEVSSW